MTLSENVITEFSTFVAGSVGSLVSLIGIVAGVFLAFAIFEKMVRLIVKTIK